MPKGISRGTQPFRGDPSLRLKNACAQDDANRAKDDQNFKLSHYPIVLYLALHVSGFYRFFLNDAEGITALLQIIGTLYSVLYAFAIYVIWGQYTAVENQIVAEAGSLKDLLLFSNPLKAATRDPIVRAVKIYSRSVVETEWRALSRGEDAEKASRLFVDVISSVTGVAPEDETQRLIKGRVLEIANQSSFHRDQRLALSVKRIPRTLMLFVSLTASLIFLLIFFYPFHNIFLGLSAIVITATLLFFAHFVLNVSCLSWKWRKRSSVKITERTYEEGTEAFHARRKSSHPEAASC